MVHTTVTIAESIAVIATVAIADSIQIDSRYMSLLHDYILLFIS